MKKATSLLIVALLMCCLATGEAWGRGGGGGGHGGGGGGRGGGYGGGGRGYGGGGRGYGGYGGYGGFGGFGYGLGLGYGLGYGGYGGYYGGYGGYPGYYGYDYGYPAYDYSYPLYDYGYPAPYGNPMPPAVSTPSVQVATQAPIQLEILVPDSQARVWVDGQLTQMTGLDRFYVTAPVERGYAYTYNIKAEWNQAGHDVTRDRQVQVIPGQMNRIDFAQPAGTATSAH